jgi:predicted ArsR family transcriptional regulator
MYVSADELSKLLDTDKLTAHHLLKLCTSKGMASLVDKKKLKSGKGRPTSIYNLNDNVVAFFKDNTN